MLIACTFWHMHEPESLSSGQRTRYFVRYLVQGLREEEERDITENKDSWINNDLELYTVSLSGSTLLWVGGGKESLSSQTDRQRHSWIYFLALNSKCYHDWLKYLCVGVTCPIRYKVIPMPKALFTWLPCLF